MSKTDAIQLVRQFKEQYTVVPPFPDPENANAYLLGADDSLTDFIYWVLENNPPATRHPYHSENGDL